MKRCIIFFFYDENGIVDRYILHILHDLKERSERIVFVCNGKLSSQSRRALQDYTQDIVVRPNEGFDVWAYREGLIYLGWEQLRKYDELVMMNHTIYPTPYSFADMFDEIEKIDTDFWGVTMFFEGKTAVAGMVPDHIQSHFIAVRRSMHTSSEFKRYWEDIRPIKSYQESVRLHETRFTKKFESYGFKSYVYCKAEELRPITNCPAYWQQRYLLEKTKIPLIKRRTFFYAYDGIITETAGEPAAEAYKILKQTPEYDTGLIWENLIRSASMNNIADALQLNYIFPDDKCLSSIQYKAKICAVIYLMTPVFTDSMIDLITVLPENSYIFILSPVSDDAEELKKRLHKYPIEVHQVSTNGDSSEEILKFLSSLTDGYDYLLTLKLNVTDKVSYASTYKTLTCLLASEKYVQNILFKFNDEPYLGLLLPTLPDRDAYRPFDKNSLKRYRNTMTLVSKEFQLKIDMTRPLVTPYLGMYWCRGETMRKILGIVGTISPSMRKKLGKCHAVYEPLDILLGTLAQKAGYYSAWVYNETFAAIDITNKNYYLRKKNII